MDTFAEAMTTFGKARNFRPPVDSVSAAMPVAFGGPDAEPVKVGCTAVLISSVACVCLCRKFRCDSIRPSLCRHALGR